jgi:hypothetical protein
MHIAHYSKVKAFTVEQIAKMTGLKRRQIAYLARKDDFPRVARPDGYHNEYPVTPQLLAWIARKKQKVANRKRPKARRKPNRASGIISVHGLYFEFQIWLRRVGGADGIMTMQRDEIQEILGEIRPVVALYHELTQRLRP